MTETEPAGKKARITTALLLVLPAACVLAIGAHWYFNVRGQAPSAVGETAAEPTVQSTQSSKSNGDLAAPGVELVIADPILETGQGKPDGTLETAAAREALGAPVKSAAAELPLDVIKFLKEKGESPEDYYRFKAALDRYEASQAPEIYGLLEGNPFATASAVADSLIAQALARAGGSAVAEDLRLGVISKLESIRATRRAVATEARQRFHQRMEGVVPLNKETMCYRLQKVYLDNQSICNEEIQAAYATDLTALRRMLADHLGLTMGQIEEVERLSVPESD